MSSYSGGLGTVALGVVLQFVIALGAATVYYLASRKLPFLVSRAVLRGLIYGALVYLFMHFVVVPLSASPHRHPSFIHQATEFVEHWFIVGPADSAFDASLFALSDGDASDSLEIVSKSNVSPARQKKPNACGNRPADFEYQPATRLEHNLRLQNQTLDDF